MNRFEFAGAATPFSDKSDANVKIRGYRRGGHFGLTVEPPPDPSTVAVPAAIHVCVLEAPPADGVTAKDVFENNLGKGTYQFPDQTFPGDIDVDIPVQPTRRYAQVVVEYPEGS